MNKKHVLGATLVAISSTFAMSASATPGGGLPAEVTSAVTSMATDVGLYAAAFVAVAVASVLGSAMLKWIKKFGNKAT